MEGHCASRWPVTWAVDCPWVDWGLESLAWMPVLGNLGVPTVTEQVWIAVRMRT